MMNYGKLVEWQVSVEGIGHIGNVFERNELFARCAALSKYVEDGSRPKDDIQKVIYNDDSFEVSKA